MASLEGQMLGQYKVIAQMGSGGMATVYKAYQERLDRFVAIKMLHEAFQEDKNFLARFQREAKIVARLEHPHIVPVYDYDQFNGRPYLVMKYVEGKTLKAELDEMPPTLDEILRILPPVADALDYAHRQGVLHRDIKPSNIILDGSGVPFLTDFGLAKMAQMGESTLSNDMLLGTPNYISPEQAMGSRDLDSRTDLYSLGVVLYELLVGRVPFSADTPFAVIHDQIYRELPRPSSINPDIKPPVDAVLVKALAKAPADRYATATEMVSAFKQAVAQSDLKTLDPDRSAAASESLANYREQQNQTPPPAQSQTLQAPDVSAPLPPIQAPAAQIQKPAPPAQPAPPSVPQQPSMPGLPLMSPPGGFPYPPSARDMRQAARELRHEAKHMAKQEHDSQRIVEAQFDFANASNVVRQAMEGIGSAFEGNNTDPDFIPMNDETAIRRRVESDFNKRKEFISDLGPFVVINAILWIIFGHGGFPWPMFITLGWGAGLAAHAVETYYATGKRVTRRLRAIQNAFYEELGPDWPTADRKELQRIRHRVTEPITKRREFFDHLAVFLCINAMFWIVFGSGGGFPWWLIITLGWGIGLVAHAGEMLSVTTRESAIEKAIAQERRQFEVDEKPKRDRRVRLTDDGEFTDSMAEEIDSEEKAKRSGRS
ncbi:MAG TPA: protein kinase [Phototrophicaceae bacterium]|nr:protein kinase [Phototrophicaceae bacterium]